MVLSTQTWFTDLNLELIQMPLAICCCEKCLIVAVTTEEHGYVLLVSNKSPAKAR